MNNTGSHRKETRFGLFRRDAPHLFTYSTEVGNATLADAAQDIFEEIRGMQHPIPVILFRHQDKQVQIRPQDVCPNHIMERWRTHRRNNS